MAITTIAQYKNKEFRRLLLRVVKERDFSFHCKKSTYDTINMLLTTEYNGKNDDIDYLMDVVNAGLKKKGCTDKRRFPISKCLDQACQNSLYLHETINQISGSKSRDI